MTRNRLLKVALFEQVHHSLIGAVVVGQHKDTIIVERPESKPRAKSATPRKPRQAKAKSATVGSAVSFPVSVQANG